MKTFLLFISLILLTTFLNAQTYINKEWVENYGSPDSIDWTSTHNDIWGNINIIGNTLVTGQRANLLLSSFDNSGFEVFPNPVSDRQTIFIRSGMSNHVVVKLYDVSGRVVKNVYEGAK